MSHAQLIVAAAFGWGALFGALMVELSKLGACPCASAIEARSDATGTGAAEGESAVAKPDAQTLPGDNK